MKKLNKKGFTLVELLAVIVVLAIIMVLTLPTIMNSMNSARQSTFLLYASRMLDTAADNYHHTFELSLYYHCQKLKLYHDILK